MEDNTEYPVLRMPNMQEEKVYASGSYTYEKVEIPLGDSSATTRCLIYSNIGNIRILVGIEQNEDVARWICENK